MSQKTTNVEIEPVDVQELDLTIIGDSRLVVHKWSHKALKEIEESQQGNARKKKAPRDPEQEFRDATYQSEDGWYGVPAAAFRNSAVDASTTVDGIAKVMVRRCVYVVPQGKDKEDATELVRIDAAAPNMRTDMVRIARGMSTPRYRPEYPTWSARIRVRYAADVVTANQVVNLFNRAGFHSGLCEGRRSAPQTSMDWGMFHVATEEEAKLLYGDVE